MQTDGVDIIEDRKTERQKDGLKTGSIEPKIQANRNGQANI